MDNSRNHSRIWNIPDPVMAERMHGVLGGLNSLMLFPYKPGNSNEGLHTNAQQATKMYQVESFSWLWGRHARKLVNEAVGTFLSLQSAMSEMPPDGWKSLLVKKSREYRSMIQACSYEINVQLQSMKSDDLLEDEDELAKCGQVLSKMELILGLLEILFIDKKPGGVILGQLMAWIHQHFPQCMDKKREALESDHPHQHVAYWDAIYCLVLQGQLEDAREMLVCHPSSGTDPFLSIDELLRKMPVYQVYSGIAESEFMVRWSHWQSECERRLQDGHFTTCHQLNTVCQILCGDQSTINGFIDLMDTWYHLMVSTLIYTNPMVKLFRLPSAAQDAINASGGEDSTRPLDLVLLSAMEADIHEVIKQCQQVLDNNWFTAHVIDLLYHMLMMKGEHKFLPELREALVLDYASILVGHPSLWQVGVLYLDHCGPSGTEMSRAVLNRIPLTDDAKAHKVIQMAADRNFDSVVVSVCRVMGRRALSEDRLGAAIWWGVRSKDSAFTSHLAHKILHKYIAEGRFESSPLLDNLGPAMLLSDTLTFLGKYREFHTMYQDGNFLDAASLLVSLISSKLAPEYFWPILLLDALPLLKSTDPVISAEQTYELMYCLHNLSHSTSSSKENPMDTEAARSSFLEKEKEIRLALSNNLARAIIHEGTVIED